MKPMLAEDADSAKLRWPLIVQPKIDGVRGLNMTGQFTGRSLKPPKNKYTSRFYSHPFLMGMDGEIAAAGETDPELCRKTSSALSTMEGSPFTLWWLFDYVTEQTARHPYEERLSFLHDRVRELAQLAPTVWGHLRIVKTMIAYDIEELEHMEIGWLDDGYEGIIIRDPKAPHKQGRSTVNEGGLLRIKRFVEAEARVVRYVEGSVNENEAQTNELGKTFRSSHAENKTPNGQVGTIEAIDVATGKEINVGPGAMPHADRAWEWKMREHAPGRLFTYKSFPKGVKDKPRFPTWKCWRDAVDTSA